MNIPYYEKLVNMFYQGEMDQELFFNLLIIDEGLKKWYDFHEVLRDALFNDD